MGAQRSRAATRNRNRGTKGQGNGQDQGHGQQDQGSMTTAPLSLAVPTPDLSKPPGSAFAGPLSWSAFHMLCSRLCVLLAPASSPVSPLYSPDEIARHLEAQELVYAALTTAQQARDLERDTERARQAFTARQARKFAPGRPVDGRSHPPGATSPRPDASNRRHGAGTGHGDPIQDQGKTPGSRILAFTRPQSSNRLSGLPSRLERALHGHGHVNDHHQDQDQEHQHHHHQDDDQGHQGPEAS